MLNCETINRTPCAWRVIQVMKKKLTWFAIIAFLVPVIFVADNEYVTGFGLFGYEVMHGVQYHGIQLFFCLLVVAAAMFFAGLAHPKLSLWTGEKTRKRSSIVYATVVAVAIVGLVEVNLIAFGIHKYEERMMAAFYEQVELGALVNEATHHSHALNKHLGYSYALSESGKDLEIYDQNRNFVDFSYPDPLRSRRTIVETDIHPGLEEARIIGKFLLENNRITKSET